MKFENSKLDNPVWNSLNEMHQRFSVEYDGIKFYHPQYCPFGGFANANGVINGLNEYSNLISQFYIVGDKPLYGDQISLHKNLVCNQMVIEKTINLDINEQITELKTDDQKADLSELVNLVQPGYFKNKTSELGRYFGIYINGKLVAAAGERMSMNLFTEISAVVTHPDHTRKGFAKQLSKIVADKIFDDKKIPILHVLNSNEGAIALYEKLGFTTRRKISFWQMKLNI